MVPVFWCFFFVLFFYGAGLIREGGGVAKRDGGMVGEGRGVHYVIGLIVGRSE